MFDLHLKEINDVSGSFSKDARRIATRSFLALGLTVAVFPPRDFSPDFSKVRLSRGLPTVLVGRANQDQGNVELRFINLRHSPAKSKSLVQVSHNLRQLIPATGLSTAYPCDAVLVRK